MSEIKTHTGSCHCGKVRFEVTLDISEPAITCNCSMCGRSGTMLRFVPISQFKLLSGAEVLKDYRFNTNNINHHFCSVCGIKPFYVPRSHPEGYSVNVRCLDDGALPAARVRQFDGQHWEAAHHAARGGAR